MIDKQIIDEMIEKIGFDVQQCGYLKITKDALNYPEIGGTFTAFECNLYSRDCDFIERCRYKQLLRKEQECEELKKQLERKEKNYQKLLSKSNKYIHNLVDENVQDISNLSRQLEQFKVENDKLKKRITKIFACLIKANRTNKIFDTIWVDNITTLWDYIALTLGIEGDQVQIEKQILQKISECEVKNE